MKSFGRTAMSMGAGVVLMIGLSACGGADSAESGTATSGATVGGGSAIPESTYISTQNIDFMSAYPEFTYKQATFGDQVLELYADGTYRLVSINSMYSGTLTFPDEGEYEAVPRGSTATTFYGVATVSEDDGLSTVSLSAPTSAVTVSNFATSDDPAGLLDTANWTDEMGTAAAAASRQEGNLSAEEYLATISFGDIEVIVDDATHTFDYIKSTPESPQSK